jgi:hypothetical protein
LASIVSTLLSLIWGCGLGFQYKEPSRKNNVPWSHVFTVMTMESLLTRSSDHYDGQKALTRWSA